MLFQEFFKKKFGNFTEFSKKNFRKKSFFEKKIFEKINHWKIEWIWIVYVISGIFFSKKIFRKFRKVKKFFAISKSFFRKKNDRFKNFFWVWNFAVLSLKTSGQPQWLMDLARFLQLFLFFKFGSIC